MKNQMRSIDLFHWLWVIGQKRSHSDEDESSEIEDVDEDALLTINEADDVSGELNFAELQLSDEEPDKSTKGFLRTILSIFRFVFRKPYPFNWYVNVDCSNYLRIKKMDAKKNSDIEWVGLLCDYGWIASPVFRYFQFKLLVHKSLIKFKTL